MKPTRALLWAMAAVALLACSEDLSTTDGVVTAWRNEGLKPTSFESTEMDGVDAKACKRGKIDGVDATLCEFEDEAAAEAAQPEGLKAIGNHTGASLASGKMLLVVADTEKADPHGRTINKITRVFRGRE